MKYSWSLLTRFFTNYFRIHFFPQKPVKPLIMAYFLTFRCNLRCEYCIEEENLDSITYPELNTEQTIKILKLVRTGVPSIAFSGGEPLLRDDIITIVQEARALGFKPISLFTNALYLPQREAILKYIDFLQISLDTMDDARQDKIFGVNKKGLSHEIKDIIKYYAKKQDKENFQINLNSVINPYTINDIPALYSYTKGMGLRLTVCPQLKEGQPIPSLIHNRDYISLMEQIRYWKRNDSTILDTEEFLKHIQTFEPYKCYPFLTPRIYPNGELIAPCPIYKKVRINLMNYKTWEEVAQQVFSQIGNNFTCPKSCFLPCYLETSTLFDSLSQSIRELMRLAKGNSNKTI